MFNVGGPEFLVILLVALLVLGPDRLPEAIRKVGSVIREFRKISDGFQNEFRQAMEVPGEPVVKPRSRPNLAAVADTPEDPTPDQDTPEDPTRDRDTAPDAEDEDPPTEEAL